MVKPGYKQTEIGVIPEDWEVKSFKDVGEYFKGAGISMKDITLSGFPCIMYGDIYVKFDTFFKSCDYRIDAITAKKSVVAKPGDLLFTASGETAEDIGRCVSYQGSEPIYIGGDIIALRPSSEYDSLFLSYVQNSDYLKKQKASFAQGYSVVHIGTSNLQKVKFACPNTLEEQRRIAEALSDMDSFITSLEKVIEKKKAIKQGTMRELLTGERRLPGFLCKRDYKQTEIGVIPTDWEVCLLGNVANIFRGGSPRPIQKYITGLQDGINWIKIGDVKETSKYITSTEEKIIPSGVKYSREVHAGDFILSNSMSFGRPYILAINGCIHDGWLTIQDYQNAYFKDFLYYLLSSENVFQQYVAMAAGSSVKNLNKEKVASLILPLPPLDEQRNIAKILSDMDSEIEALERKLDKYRAVKRGMTQELLTGKIRLK